MTEDSLLPFDLPAVRRKKVTADFGVGLISSDGGVVLLREAERRLGLAEALAGCIREWRDPATVPYRATPAQTRPGYLSLPASGQRGDHGRRQLYELVGWRRVMTDTPQVLLTHHLKTLKLPTFLREYDKLARQCATEGADHVRYLVRLTELELIDRERRMVERRTGQARFPAVKSLDSFDFKAIASLNKMLVLELARCEYVERRENIIALGNSGTGKTHIALGLGLAACQKGLSVGFLTAAALVHELMEARDEKRLLRLVPPIYSIHRRNLGILHHHRIPFPACIRSSKSSRTARRSTQKSLPCDSR